MDLGTVGAIVLIALLLVGLAGFYVIRRMGRPPANNPAAFVRAGGRVPGRRVVVVLGASMVQGRVGADFVALLARDHPDTTFVNAGVNGDTAWHVRRRLDAVVACDPDMVLLLVGTNDVTGTLRPESWQMYRPAQRPPQPPGRAFYRATLQDVVTTLQARTHARLAVCSLPVMGEALDSPPNRAIAEFNGAIREVAAATGAAYVPVFEREAAWLPGALAARGWPPRAYDGNPRTSLRLGLTGCMLHYLLGQSFSMVAARRGMLLKTDFVHGTEAEAEIIATALAPVLEAAPLPA